MRRVGVLSVVQETNTFAPRPTTLADFESQGLHRGARAGVAMSATNTRLAGALEESRLRGVEPVAVGRAWAMSGGRLEHEVLRALGGFARDSLAEVGRLDGLVLSLHGALAAEGVDDADAWLLETVRDALGPAVPVVTCLDLHANVTANLIAMSDALMGYHTYPHVDQAATGARAAALLTDRLVGSSRPVTAYAKRPMLLPAETTQTTSGPMAALRSVADRLTRPPVLDISIFPVQPWLDVAELGFAVTVTVDSAHPEIGGADSAPSFARALAEELADIAWAMRPAFEVDLVSPVEAIRAARERTADGPLLASESADSPSAGATADSPAMVDALLRHGVGLPALVTLVDAPAVARCHEVGVDGRVELHVGATLDGRFHEPVGLRGRVDHSGAGLVRLAGHAHAGIEVNMGRWAVVSSGDLRVLLTERPAPTFDPASYRSVGLEPRAARLVVVRSANQFRASWSSISQEAVILDLPGASTPRLDTLRFERAPRPLYPVDTVGVSEPSPR